MKTNELSRKERRERITKTVKEEFFSTSVQTTMTRVTEVVEGDESQ